MGFVLSSMIIQCPQCQSRYNTGMKNPGDAIHCRCGLDFLVPELPNLARSWNCPSCGGGVDPSESRCEYCKAYIAFARCPACFSIAPYDEAKHCAECGELLVLPVKPIPKGKSKLPCPRCTNHLHSKVVDSHLVDYCSDCGGVWLRHHLFDNLLKNEPQNTSAALGKRSSAKAGKLPRHEVRYLRCPECNATMSRHNFMRDSNIILDQCNEHGIWFDKYELAVALEFVRSTTKSASNRKSIKEKNEAPEKELITKRDESEVFEIKNEDLQLLLEEFPHWVKK